MVCANAHAPTQWCFDRIVFHLLRDLSNRGRKFSRARCRIDRAVHARPILFVFPDCDRRRVRRGGEKTSDISEQEIVIPSRVEESGMKRTANSRDASTPLRFAEDNSVLGGAFVGVRYY